MISVSGSAPVGVTETQHQLVADADQLGELPGGERHAAEHADDFLRQQRVRLLRAAAHQPGAQQKQPQHDGERRARSCTSNRTAGRTDGSDVGRRVGVDRAFARVRRSGASLRRREAARIVRLTKRLLGRLVDRRRRRGGAAKSGRGATGDSTCAAGFRCRRLRRVLRLANRPTASDRARRAGRAARRLWLGRERRRSGEQRQRMPVRGDGATNEGRTSCDRFRRKLVDEIERAAGARRDALKSAGWPGAYSGAARQRPEQPASDAR